MEVVDAPELVSTPKQSMPRPRAHEPAEVPPSAIEEVDDTCFADMPAGIHAVKPPSYVTKFLPPLRAFGNGDENDLSPPWEYRDVKIIVGDKTHIYDLVQDNSGLDCGVCIPNSELSLGPLVRSASQMAQHLSGGRQVETECTVVVCEVEVQCPPIKVFTIALGLDKKAPLLGRFMLHDVVARTYSGILSDPTEGVPSPGQWTSLGTVPPWKVIQERFQQSRFGQQLRQKVEAASKEGTIRFKGKLFGQALAHYRWVSVFGFFTHSPEEQYTILKNLATGWEYYLQEKNERSDTALLWAYEAQKCQDTEVIRNQIARIKARNASMEGK